MNRSTCLASCNNRASNCTTGCCRDVAWAAGFVDGEGCISLSKTTQPGRKHPTYRPRFDLTQNNREVLVEVREILGEAAGLYANKRQPGQNRQTYSLVFDGVHALRAIAKLRPELRRKQVEADELLSYPGSSGSRVGGFVG